MPNIIKTIFDPSAERRRRERDLEDARAVEMAYKLAAFAERLFRHRHLFERHGLLLAVAPFGKYPAIYIIKRDHSAHANVWWCHDSLRLESSRRVPGGDTVPLMEVTLSADPDLAEDCLLRLLKSGALLLGDGYLPGDLLPLDRFRTSLVPADAPPTIETGIVPRTAATPRRIDRLVPVPLEPKTRRSWWRR